MAVIQYWHGRIRDRNPLYLEGLRIEGYNIRPRPNVPDTWPRAVAKQALYLDYLGWFDKVFLEDYRNTPYYQDNPGALPRPVDALEFFISLSPFVHLVGRAQQTRTYRVTEQRQFEGRYVAVKTTRNFVRLCPWEEHAAQFGLITGFDYCDPPIPAASSLKRDRIEMVARGVEVAVRKIAANREAMPIGKAK